LFQTATFIIVVPLATAISKGDNRYRKKLGPVHVNATVGKLLVITLITVVVAAVLDIWIAWMRSQIVSKWELSRREAIIREYLHSDYSTQAGERLGTLATLVGYANRGAAALGNITNGLEAISPWGC
jgi:ABC-type transport system involved in cytochrome bd biosynthesis fused ATPase/permease subunit